MEEHTKEVRFSPAACGTDEERTFSRYARYLRPGVIVLGVLFILFHIEVGFGAAADVPETVLVQVLDDEGHPETAAQCYADIVSETVNEKKMPLRGLKSLYEVIDPRAFQASTDTGFYLLDTGLSRRDDTFEIRIVCYAPELSGVSYTIVNEDNRQECSIKEDGRLLLCNH